MHQSAVYCGCSSIYFIIESIDKASIVIFTNINIILKYNLKETNNVYKEYYVQQIFKNF